MNRDLIISMEEAARRWPRLMGCAQWVAILTWSEAAAMLRDWPRYRNTADERIGSEAVMHFGGPRAVLHAAIESRHYVSRCYRRAA
jgi:hypothetical protein